MGRLAALPVNARFAPVIEEPVVVDGRGRRLSMGSIRLQALPDAADRPFDAEKLEMSAVVSSDLAARFHWTKGDTIDLRGRDAARAASRSGPSRRTEHRLDRRRYRRRTELLGMYGKLDRIEVFLGAGEDAATVERLVKAAIPDTWEIETPGARSEENRRMLRAFRWNLRILSYISLLVGAFLIYNTIAVSVVRRRTEIGILRALGTSSRGVLTVFLAEAAMLGLIGSAVGVFLGRFSPPDCWE